MHTSKRHCNEALEISAAPQKMNAAENSNTFSDGKWSSRSQKVLFSDCVNTCQRFVTLAECTTSQKLAPEHRFCMPRQKRHESRDLTAHGSIGKVGIRNKVIANLWWDVVTCALLLGHSKSQLACLDAANSDCIALEALRVAEHCRTVGLSWPRSVCFHVNHLSFLFASQITQQACKQMT